MKVLVTGGGGFLGRPVTGELQRRGHSVIGLSRSDGEIACDLTDSAATAAATAGLDPDAVVHLAGSGSVAASWQEPAGCFESNTATTWNLLEAIAATGKAPHFLLASSAAVYGIPDPTLAHSVTEDAALDPVSPYGAAKAAAELIARQYGTFRQMPVTVVRLFNQSGPGAPDHGVPGEFADAIATAEASGEGRIDIEITDPGIERDFTDVRDTARAIADLLEVGGTGTFNLCSGTTVPIGQVLEALADAATVTVGTGTRETDRPVDVPILGGDPGRLREETGWVPEVTLRESLTATLEAARGKAGPTDDGS